MKTYKFKDDFALQIEAGLKKQTIRKKTSHAQINDKLQLICGGKTYAAICTNAQGIMISKNGEIRLDGELLLMNSAHQFAINDGFNNKKDFIDFFKNIYGLPFVGVVINWEVI